LQKKSRKRHEKHPRGRRISQNVAIGKKSNPERAGKRGKEIYEGRKKKRRKKMKKKVKERRKRESKKKEP